MQDALNRLGHFRAEVDGVGIHYPAVRGAGQRPGCRGGGEVLRLEGTATATSSGA
jgi:hypothetical protein